MNAYDIPGVLKRLRKESGLSAKDTVKALKEHGITISHNTVYGYESGLSMPNADTFVALCMIYGCENPVLLMEQTMLPQPEPPPKEKSLTEEMENLLDSMTPEQAALLLSIERRILGRVTELAAQKNHPPPHEGG